MEPQSKIISALGDSGGAIGIVCGLLLICTYICIRYLVERGKERDSELSDLHRQLQDALVVNAAKMAEHTAAITLLSQTMQQRPCLSPDLDALKTMRSITQVLEKKGGKHG